MFLSLQQRADLGLREPEVTGVEVTVLPNGVISTKEKRIAKLRQRDFEPSFTFNTEKEDQLLKCVSAPFGRSLAC